MFSHSWTDSNDLPSLNSDVVYYQFKLRLVGSVAKSWKRESVHCAKTLLRLRFILCWNVLLIIEVHSCRIWISVMTIAQKISWRSVCLSIKRLHPNLSVIYGNRGKNFFLICNFLCVVYLTYSTYLTVDIIKLSDRPECGRVLHLYILL